MKKRVLVTVLTYPCPSEKYVETVCTAGITEEGDWIRIYPLKLRLLQNSLSKFNWYDFDIEKRPPNKDFRKESFHILGDPDCNSIDWIKPTRKGWQERKSICVDKVGCYSNINHLIDDSNIKKKDFISLATFKPTRVIDFYWEKKKDLDQLDRKKEEILKKFHDQSDLFAEGDIPEYWKMAKSIPYNFKYRFEDDEGNIANLSVEDWEVCMLYLNCIKTGDDEETALQKVKHRYYDDFIKTDLYFFMGTRYEDHRRNLPHPYSIIGVFHPPKELQPNLF